MEKQFLQILLLLLVHSIEVSAQKANSDTTFLLRETHDNIYHAIFIDPDKSSKYYNWVSDFSFGLFDTASYLESIKYLRSIDSTPFVKHDLKVIPTKWCAVKYWQGNYYAYAPSDWGNDYKIEINDTTMIEYFMDGPAASKINSIQKVEGNFQLNLTAYGNLETKMIIHVIDKKNGLAVFETFSKDDDSGYFLMALAEKIKSFPLIVNYCETQKQLEFQFEDPDYRALLNTRK